MARALSGEIGLHPEGLPSPGLLLRHSIDYSALANLMARLARVVLPGHLHHVTQRVRAFFHNDYSFRDTKLSAP
jgi:hypothetical protein